MGCSRPGRVEQATDKEADRCSPKADGEELEAAPAPVADERYRGVGADCEEGEGAQDDGHDERRRARQHQERDGIR